MFEIWEQLSNSGYTTKTFEEFQSEYSSEEGQKLLHEKLTAADMTSKNFEVFSSEYFTTPPKQITDTVSKIKGLPCFISKRLERKTRKS